MNQKQKKKVAIAKDVIAQVKQHKYIPATGTYVGGYGGNRIVVAVGDLQKAIRNVSKKNPCEVCALGSAFLSTVRLYDRYTQSPQGLRYPQMRRKLREFFSSRELGAIEASFEDSISYLRVRRDSIDWTTLYGYRAFLAKLSDMERLIFLMQVIIDNGEFTLDLAARAAWAQVSESRRVSNGFEA
jgi:hypothetical protein